MTLWERWLDELRGSDPCTAEWDAWEAFVQDATAIVVVKREERKEQVQRQSLDEAIRVLRESRTQWIEYFGLVRCQVWSAKLCPRDVLEDTRTLLAEFDGLLDRYAELAADRPTTFAERRAQNTEITALEDRVLQEYVELNARLCPEFAETPPGESGEGPSSEISESEPDGADTGDADSGDADAVVSTTAGAPAADAATVNADDVGTVPVDVNADDTDVVDMAEDGTTVVEIAVVSTAAADADAADSAAGDAGSGDTTTVGMDAVDADATDMATANVPTVDTATVATATVDTTTVDAGADDTDTVDTVARTADEPGDTPSPPEPQPREPEPVVVPDEDVKLERIASPNRMEPVAYGVGELFPDLPVAPPAEELLSGNEEPFVEPPPVEEEDYEELESPQTSEPSSELPLSAQTPMLELVDLPPEQLDARLVQLIGEGDLSGAYWLAWAQEIQELRPPVVPAWLLAALQGQFWAAASWPSPSAALMRELAEIAQNNLPIDSPIQQLFGTAAALLLTLLDPASDWADWLDVTVEDVPDLNGLLDAIRTFAQRAWPLQPDEVRGLQSEASLKAIVENAVSEAKRWMKQAPTQHTNFQRATDVWWELLKSKTGEISLWMEWVARNQHNQRDEVEKAIARWRDRRWVDEHIQDIDRQLKGRRRNPIVGTARNQIIRWVNDACGLAEQWLEAIDLCDQFLRSGDWLRKTAEELVQRLRLHLPKVQAQLKSLMWPDQGLEAVALRMLDLVCAALETWLSNAVYTVPTSHCPGDFETRSLYQNLAYRLFWFPDIPLSDEGVPDAENAPLVIHILADASKCNQTLASVLQYYWQNHDYRWVNSLLQNNDDDLGVQLRGQGREAFRRDLKQLDVDLAETTTLIERALIDLLIGETDFDAARSEALGLMEVIRVRLSDLSRDEADIPSVNLGVWFKRLSDKRTELSEQRKARVQHLNEEWENYQRLLERQALEEGALEVVQQAVRRVLKSDELRAVQEHLVHLGEVVQGGKPLNLARFRSTSERDPLLEFLRAQRTLRDVLERNNIVRLAEAVRFRRGPEFLGTDRLPEPRLQEVYQALLSWNQLKRTNGSALRQRDRLCVLNLLQYLGFMMTAQSPLSSVPAQRSNFQHWRLAGTIPIGAPVPQFGSDMQKRYNVVGAWERPGFDLIASVMKEMGEQPVILLYFARLLPRQRYDLMRLTRKYRLPLLVVDEVLLLFLVREYANRFNRLFPVALPFATLNPYVPFAAGSVPPEMFVGRLEESQKLRDFRGPAIVYGGRQLGKSALLKFVQREFHKPEIEHYAIFEDIKELGDPRFAQEYERAFLDRMVNAFAEAGLLRRQSRYASIEGFITAVRRGMSEVPERYVLLLLDEADKFLEADADRDFWLVSALKRLMDDTNRRFKVVLAGLHSVQRYERLPNQPLAHLGTPVPIGPLDFASAQELVRRPLRALGFRFGSVKRDDSALILQILSYTNYHPALIQLFCYRLLEYMQSRANDKQLPFVITREDIESVYRQEEVRKQIRERFNWTLALDDRYEAITLALILDQWEQQNGFDRPYTLQEIREKVLSWWPQGFVDIEDDRFKGYLEEMLGLGVLSYQSDGSYRLRSPNLIHLMGTKPELEDRLVAICSKQPPSPLVLESHHTFIDSKTGYYNPLTFAEMRVVDATRSGVCLVFGSKAVGFGNLRESLRLSSQGASDSRTWEEIKAVARSEEATKRLLQEARRRKKGFRHLLIYRDLMGDTEDLVAQVKAAISFCEHNARPELRVVFALDPLSAWNWFSLSEQVRIDLERKLDVISLSLWDEVGIRQILEHRELPSDDAACQDVKRVTGGWPFLLDEFFRQLPEGQVIRSHLRDFEQVLSESGSATLRSFLGALDIPPGLPRHLIDAIKTEKSGVPQSLVAPVLAGDEPSDLVNATLDYLVRMAVLRRENQPRDEPLLHLDLIIANLWGLDGR